MQKKSEELLELALKSRDLEKKLEYCAEYLELNPSDVDMWEYKSGILSYLGRHEESIDCRNDEYDRLLKDDPSLFWGIASLVYGKYDKAIEFLDDVLRTRPDCARAWLKKGSALVGLKRWEEGLACVDRSMKLGLGKVCEVEAWLERGRALYQLHKSREALRSFDNALDIDPCNTQALIEKGILLGYETRWEEASTYLNNALELLKEQPEDGLTVVKGLRDVAERELERRGKRTAKTISQKMNKSEKTEKPASRHCVKCHSSIPLDALYCTECGTREEKLEELLDLALKSSDLEKKLEYCTEYLELNPGNSDAWIYKGDILEYLGRNEEAKGCEKRAMELLFRDDYPYWCGLRSLAFDRLDEAIELLDTVLRDKRDHAGAWLNKGIALARLKRREEGLACVDKSMELGLSRVREVQARFERGIALYILGKSQEALDCLDNALDIDPCNPRVLGVKGDVLKDAKVARYEDALGCFNRALGILNKCLDKGLVESLMVRKQIVEQILGQTGKQTMAMAEREKMNESEKTGKPASGRCIKCHSSIPLDALYCTECGTKQ